MNWALISVLFESLYQNDHFWLCRFQFYQNLEKLIYVVHPFLLFCIKERTWSSAGYIWNKTTARANKKWLGKSKSKFWCKITNVRNNWITVESAFFFVCVMGRDRVHPFQRQIPSCGRATLTKLWITNITCCDIKFETTYIYNLNMNSILTFLSI